MLSAVLLIGFATSCGKSPDAEAGIVAEWKLAEMTGYEAEALPSVYIEFTADNNFVIYQKVGDIPRYRKYTGTYSISDSVVSGEYSDKEDWGSSYRVSFESEGDILVLTALAMDKAGNITEEGEVCKYIKASLSQEEKDAADVVTKSTEDISVRFL